MSKCNCVSEINKNLDEGNTNTRIKTPIVISSDLSVADGGSQEIVTEKIDTKKRGKPMSLLSSYCPFCGVKHKSPA